MGEYQWRGKRFVIKRERLEEACARLGIKQPVELSIRAMKNNDGILRGFRDGAFRITLDPYMSPDYASSTLWHELVHVMQAEREGGWEAYDVRSAREMREAGLEGPDQRKYFRERARRNMPLEREADEIGERCDKELPLARPR
jgi:hypothetical protein